MALRFETVTVDSHDSEAQARWWGELLGWEVTHEEDDEWVVAPPGGGADLLFI